MGQAIFLLLPLHQIKIFSPLRLLSIKSLVEDLKNVNGIKNVLSLFDVPLLKYSEQSISELAENVVTLSTENVNLNKAKYEFETNEVYRGLLISEDLKTIAFQMSLEENQEYQKLISERYDLLDQKNSLTRNFSKQI